MWFQDLFGYDMSAERMDATPVGTVEGEIAFSGYNAAGWRQIVEHLHQTASLSDWHKRNGRHPDLHARQTHPAHAGRGTDNESNDGVTLESSGCDGRSGRPVYGRAQARPGPSLRSGPWGACGGLDPPSARPGFGIYRSDREDRARNKGT